MVHVTIRNADIAFSHQFFGHYNTLNGAIKYAEKNAKNGWEVKITMPFENHKIVKTYNIVDTEEPSNQ